MCLCVCVGGVLSFYVCFVWSSRVEGGAVTVAGSLNLLYPILAPKASWIPEAPRHFEKSQWGSRDVGLRGERERDSERSKGGWDVMLSARV